MHSLLLDLPIFCFSNIFISTIQSYWCICFNTYTLSLFYKFDKPVASISDATKVRLKIDSQELKLLLNLLTQLL